MLPGSEVIVLPGDTFAELPGQRATLQLVGTLAGGGRPESPTTVALQGRVVHSWLEAGMTTTTLVEVKTTAGLLTVGASRVVQIPPSNARPSETGTSCWSNS